VRRLDEYKLHLVVLAPAASSVRFDALLLLLFYCNWVFTRWQQILHWIIREVNNTRQSTHCKQGTQNANSNTHTVTQGHVIHLSSNLILFASLHSNKVTFSLK
jgi:hypothetical protein